MAAISGTENHKLHWFTKCNCGEVISTCGCDAARTRGEGPRRTIINGCKKCAYRGQMRPYTDAQIEYAGKMR